MFEFKTGAKVVQIERKTKFYLSFSEMQPIFDHNFVDKGT